MAVRPDPAQGRPLPRRGPHGPVVPSCAVRLGAAQPRAVPRAGRPPGRPLRIAAAAIAASPAPGQRLRAPDVGRCCASGGCRTGCREPRPARHHAQAVCTSSARASTYAGPKWPTSQDGRRAFPCVTAGAHAARAGCGTSRLVDLVPLRGPGTWPTARPRRRCDGSGAPRIARCRRRCAGRWPWPIRAASRGGSPCSACMHVLAGLGPVEVPGRVWTRRHRFVARADLHLVGHPPLSGVRRRRAPDAGRGTARDLRTGQVRCPAWRLERFGYTTDEIA